MTKERQASTMDELIEMIIVYAEHIYDETHAKGVGELNGEKAIGDDHYFDDLIYYGEKYLEFVKAARAMARALELKKEETQNG